MQQKTKNTLIYLFLLMTTVFFLFKSLGLSSYVLIASFAFSYLCLPIEEKLVLLGFNRSLAAILLTLTFPLIFILLCIFFGPILFTQSKDLISRLPEIIQSISSSLRFLADKFGLEIPIETYSTPANSIKNILELVHNQTILKLFFPSIQNASDFLMSILRFLIGILSFALFPVFFYYFFTQLEKFKLYFISLIPISFKYTAIRLIESFDKVLSGYIRGQISIALILTICYSLGFTLIGIKYGFLTGVIAGLLSCIPYLGASFAIISSSILLATHFEGWFQVGMFIIVIALIQFFEGYVLSPKIVGNKVGLSPLESILAVIISANCLGFFGILAALPIAGIVKIILRELLRTYRNSQYHR